MRLHGWHKDPPKAADFHAGKLLSAEPPPPTAASLVNRIMGAPLNQTQNDCTANSTARAIQIALTPAGALMSAQLPSRRFGYYLGGVREGSQKQDNGRYLRDVLDAYALLGMPPETVWSYDKPWDAHPSSEAFRQGFDARLSYHRISEQGIAFRDTMSRAIASGRPVVVGAPVTDGWENQDGIIPFDAPSANDPVAGGHAFCFVAYTPDGVVLLNSWGSDWACKGYGFVTWAWAESQVQDAWVIDVVAP